MASRPVIWSGCSRIEVEICDGPHRTPIGDDVKPLDRKGQAVWRFGARNDQLADIADACAQRDVERLWRHGLFVDQEAFPYRAPGPNWVAVLVESPEHARELARRLPGWRVQQATAEVPQHGGPLGERRKTVTTLLYAHERGAEFAPDILIVGGCNWLSALDTFPGNGDPRHRIIIDIADDFDDQAASDSKSRILSYCWRWWTVRAPQRWLLPIA